MPVKWCNAAWDKTIPANDGTLSAFPAACRANWEALEAMTDAALLITNAKISPTAAIADTKLAQITTAAKVHGTAITGLASLPAGAGVIPDANLPGKITVDVSDTTPQLLSGVIDTGEFQISAGDLLQIKPSSIDYDKLSLTRLNVDGTTDGSGLLLGSDLADPTTWNQDNAGHRFFANRQNVIAVVNTNGGTNSCLAGGDSGTNVTWRIFANGGCLFEDDFDCNGTGNFAGLLTLQNGLTVSGGSVTLPNNAIVEAAINTGAVSHAKIATESVALENLKTRAAEVAGTTIMSPNTTYTVTLDSGVAAGILYFYIA